MTPGVWFCGQFYKNLYIRPMARNIILFHNIVSVGKLKLTCITFSQFLSFAPRLSLLKSTLHTVARLFFFFLIRSRYFPVKSLSLVQSFSYVRLFGTTWTACQTSLSITDSQNLLKLMSIELVMPSNHLILCHPLLLLPSIFPSIRVFPNESILHIWWPKYWSFSISPSNEYSGLISFRID